MKTAKALALCGTLALSVSLIPATAFAQIGPVAAPAQPITPYIDGRYRLEFVDQAGLPENATASTLRVRGGLKTAEWNGLSGLVEVEAITNIGPENFNDTLNGKTRYPVVADPEDILINQAWLRFRPDPRFEITAGRQTVNLDNQRWMGSVGWRQNDQTLDAVRLSAKPIKSVSADYVYSWRVNRVFGPESPQGTLRDTDIHGARLGLQLGKAGTLSGYGYWLDIPAQKTLNSRTLGVRFAGDTAITPKVKLTYAAEYAKQRNHANNPLAFDHDYWLAEPGIAAGPVAVKLGYEHLGSDGRSALQTPLATLHAFNGWADKFLTTPVNGLADLYLDASYKLPPLGFIKNAGLRGVYHDYRSTHGNIHYGSEWNAMLNVPITPHWAAAIKYAHYNADRFATDTSKAWFQVEFKY